MMAFADSAPGAKKLVDADRARAMRATLAEALTASAQVFKQWHYMHEEYSAQAGIGEMRRAYAALAD
jgi:hypothetical protein